MNRHPFLENYGKPLDLNLVFLVRVRDTRRIGVSSLCLSFSICFSCMIDINKNKLVITSSSESLEAMFVCRMLRQRRSVRLWSCTSESRVKYAHQRRR